MMLYPRSNTLSSMTMPCARTTSVPPSLAPDVYLLELTSAKPHDKATY